MSKAQLKNLVMRKKFSKCAKTIPRRDDDSKNNLVPYAEPNDPTQTLDNVTHIVADSGVSLHGYSTMERGPDGVWRLRGQTGSMLAGFITSPVRRAFKEHDRLDTYVISMDKGIFMPRPKGFVQANRTSTLLSEIERRGLQPLAMPADGSLPSIVEPDKPLPPWVCVRANRELYRAATAQALELVAATYKPPAGRRLIIDCLDARVSSPDSIDEWMCTERIECDEFARNAIERARPLLAGLENWRAEARSLVTELAHEGHILSVPICVETSLDGITHPPFLLRNAANDCGEADVGILFWLHALESVRAHRTLVGVRRMGPQIEEPEFDEAVGSFYEPEELALSNMLAALCAEQPLPLDVQRQQEQEFLARLDGLQLDVTADQGALHGDAAQAGAGGERERRARTLLREPLPGNRCRAANQALVLTVDTDFFALLVLHFAQMAAEAARREPTSADGWQYAIDNAPLLSIGECNSYRVGWMEKFEDWHQTVPAEKRRRIAEERAQMSPEQLAALPPDPQVFKTLEVWCIWRILERLCELLPLERSQPLAPGTLPESAPPPPQRTPDQRIELAASFAAYCASCGNDYLKGLAGVNHSDMFAAFCDVGGRLALYNAERVVLLIPPDYYTNYIKTCYHRSLSGKIGKANKPTRPASEMSLEQMSELTAKKYKAARSMKNRVPDAEVLALMLERTQWWVMYAFRAWQSIGDLLDDTLWGWRAGTTDRMV